MRKRALLEISVETLDAALAAARGGADRIELCESLPLGGVTPRVALMREARERIQLPIFVMIRPRAGDFCYSAEEFARMKEETAAAKSAGMDGVVLGILTGEARVDMERTAQLVTLAQPLPVTFHRAYDELSDLEQGLEDVMATGAARVLTSGGKATAEEGRAEIARLVKQAGKRITVLPGGGIRPEILGRIVRVTGASEFHSGLSSLLPYPRREHERFEAGVCELVRVLGEEARNLQPAPNAD